MPYTIRRPAGVSDWKVLFFFLFLACTCSFVVLLRVFASSESRSPPLELLVLVLVLVLRLLDYYDYDDDYYYYYYSSSYSYSYSYANTYSDSFTPLLLPPCFPKFYTGSAGSQWHCIQHYRRLQVLVTGRTRYWSTSAHLVCVPLGVQARTCYSSCFWSTALSSPLLLAGIPPSVRINLPWGNLSSLPPCLLPCSGLLSSQRLIHSTWRYFAGGGTTLVYGQ